MRTVASCSKGLQSGLGAYPESFRWTHPEAGFFSVFTFLNPNVTTDDAFISRLVSEYGVVAIPMYDFYPADARRAIRAPASISCGCRSASAKASARSARTDLREAVAAFAAPRASNPAWKS